MQTPLQGVCVLEFARRLSAGKGFVSHNRGLCSGPLMWKAEDGGNRQMAIFHLSAKFIGRSSGRSAVAAAAYRSGEKLENELTGEVWDFTKKGGVVLSGIEAPEGVPDWAKDRAQLWNESERKENRSNSQFAREFNIALPEEFSIEDNTKLLKEFINEHFTKRGIVSDWAIHEPNREGDERNIHAHVLTTTRKIDRDGWTEKDREGHSNKVLQEIRESWAKTVNQEMERRGLSERIDHRTLEAQGIDREPQQHMGPKATAIERRGEKAERERYWKSEKQENQETPNLEKQKAIDKIELELRICDDIDRAITDPEYLAKVEKLFKGRDNERSNAILETAVTQTLERQKAEAEKMYRENVGKNEQYAKKAEKKYREADDVMKTGDREKALKYALKECAVNKAFDQEFQRQKMTATHAVPRNENEENFRKEIAEIARIREEERREQERRQEQERGGRGR